jgi:Trk-type K+ transport system membrane component
VLLASFVSSVVLPAAQAQDAGSEMNFEFDDSEFSDFGEPGFENGELSPDAEKAVALLSGGVFLVAMLVSVVFLVIIIFACYSLFDALSTVPAEHREIEPWVPWLMLVPLVQLVVNFIALTKTPRSLAKALAAKGDSSQGDCGEQLGLFTAIAALIPCINVLGFPVLLIMTVMKVNKAKALLRS